MAHPPCRAQLSSAQPLDNHVYNLFAANLPRFTHGLQSREANMTAISILSILSLLVFHTYAQDDFTVTSPGAGDTVTLSSSALSGAIVQIQWTVAEALADRPVLINLVRGNNLSSLTLIEQVECAYVPALFLISSNNATWPVQIDPNMNMNKNKKY